jgi:hypothetical protein
MSRFPTAGHPVSRAGLCPRALKSGTRTRHGKSHGNSYLRGYLGQAATGAARTATFLGERYHRIARRRGPAKAQAAVARSILVIIWHLLRDPQARYTDLGYYETKINKGRKARNHIRQLEASATPSPSPRPPRPAPLVTGGPQRPAPPALPRAL